jgi:hypothetical protein
MLAQYQIAAFAVAERAQAQHYDTPYQTLKLRSSESYAFRG